MTPKEAPLSDEQVLALITSPSRIGDDCIRCGFHRTVVTEECECMQINRCLSDLVALRGEASEMAAREETRLLKMQAVQKALDATRIVECGSLQCPFEVRAKAAESDLVAARTRERTVREGYKRGALETDPCNACGHPLSAHIRRCQTCGCPNFIFVAPTVAVPDGDKLDPGYNMKPAPAALDGVGRGARKGEEMSITSQHDPALKGIAHLLRFSDGELEVVGGPFDLADDDAIEDGIISLLVMEGWEEDDEFYLSMIGSTWADLEPLSDEYLDSLKRDANEEIEDDDREASGLPLIEEDEDGNGKAETSTFENEGGAVRPEGKGTE